MINVNLVTDHEKHVLLSFFILWSCLYHIWRQWSSHLWKHRSTRRNFSRGSISPCQRYLMRWFQIFKITPGTCLIFLNSTVEDFWIMTLFIIKMSLFTHYLERFSHLFFSFWKKYNKGIINWKNLSYRSHLLQ